jgi:hypothetical protein
MRFAPGELANMLSRRNDGDHDIAAFRVWSEWAMQAIATAMPGENSVSRGAHPIGSRDLPLYRG